jgi:hypothetical protein
MGAAGASQMASRLPADSILSILRQPGLIGASKKAPALNRFRDQPEIN